MARPPAICEEGAAISRAELEPLLFHQESSLVVSRKPADPEIQSIHLFCPHLPIPRPCLARLIRRWKVGKTYGGGIDLHNALKKKQKKKKKQCYGSKTAKLWVQSHALKRWISRG